MKKKILHLLVIVSLAIAFVVLAWFRLVVQNSDLLYEAQDQGFWMSGHTYYQQMMTEPGGWFTWAGQYLTQYFYHPEVGASILILLWLVIYLLWLVGLRLRWYLSWVALVVPMILLWAETSLGYAVYVSKIPDWWFTPTLFALAVSLVMAIGRILPRWVGWSWQAVCLLAACILAGQWMESACVPKAMRTPFHSMMEDDVFQREMRMERATEQGRWRDALMEMRRVPQAPSRSMWLLKNMALMYQGRLVKEWLDYPCMTQLPVVRDSIMVPMVETSGPWLYYLHGSIQFAYRWSMENMVEYGPSMKRLRLMTRCALVKGEWELATKYLDMLSATTYYGEWAEGQRRYLHHPELMEEDPLYRLPILLSRNRHNLLDSDESRAESYLVNSYSIASNIQNAELAEIGVVYAMQQQDIQRFWLQFFLYAEKRDNAEPMPQSVQEAAYLFIQLEPQSAIRTDFPFDPKVVEGYRQFNDRAQQLMQKGFKDKALASALQREFGRTYYWFYFFCRGLSTY